MRRREEEEEIFKVCVCVEMREESVTKDDQTQQQHSPTTLRDLAITSLITSTA